MGISIGGAFNPGEWAKRQVRDLGGKVAHRVDAALDKGASVVNGAANGAKAVVKNVAAKGPSTAVNKAVALAGDAGRFVTDKGADAKRAFASGQEKLWDSVIDKTTGLSESVESLEVGDSLNIGANGAVSAGLSGGGEGEIEVTRADDGYVVKASVSAQAGVGAARLAELELGVGATAEFKFKSSDEAKQGVQALLKLGATQAGFNPTNPLPLLGAGPSSAERAALAKNLSAVQLNGEAVAGVSIGGLGLSDELTLGAEANPQAKSGWRVEFENGKPVALTETMQITVDAAAEGANFAQKFLTGGIPPDLAQQFKQHVGFDSRSLSKVSATIEASANVEMRIPITTEPVKGGSLARQLAAIVNNPSTLIKGAPVVSAEFSASAEVNDRGVQGSITVENLRLDGLKAFVGQVSRGDIEGAFAANGLKATASFNTYEDDGRGWLDHNLDVGVAEVGGTNYVRRVDDVHEVAVQASTDGEGKKQDLTQDPVTQDPATGGTRHNVQKPAYDGEARGPAREQAVQNSRPTSQTDPTSPNQIQKKPKSNYSESPLGLKMVGYLKEKWDSGDGEWRKRILNGYTNFAAIEDNGGELKVAFNGSAIGDETHAEDKLVFSDTEGALFSERRPCTSQAQKIKKESCDSKVSRSNIGQVDWLYDYDMTQKPNTIRGTSQDEMQAGKEFEVAFRRYCAIQTGGSDLAELGHKKGRDLMKEFLASRVDYGF